MLKIDLKVGESISIGPYATVTLESKSGKVARLAIDANKEVQVSRAGYQTPVKLAATMGITGKS